MLPWTISLQTAGQQWLWAEYFEKKAAQVFGSFPVSLSSGVVFYVAQKQTLLNNMFTVDNDAVIDACISIAMASDPIAMDYPRARWIRAALSMRLMPLFIDPVAAERSLLIRSDAAPGPGDGPFAVFTAAVAACENSVEKLGDTLEHAAVSPTFRHLYTSGHLDSCVHWAKVSLGLARCAPQAVSEAMAIFKEREGLQPMFARVLEYSETRVEVIGISATMLRRSLMIAYETLGLESKGDLAPSKFASSGFSASFEHSLGAMYTRLVLNCSAMVRYGRLALFDQVGAMLCDSRLQGEHLCVLFRGLAALMHGSAHAQTWTKWLATTPLELEVYRHAVRLLVRIGFATDLLGQTEIGPLKVLKVVSCVCLCGMPQTITIRDALHLSQALFRIVDNPPIGLGDDFIRVAQGTAEMLQAYRKNWDGVYGCASNPVIAWPALQKTDSGLSLEIRPAAAVLLCLSFEQVPADLARRTLLGMGHGPGTSLALPKGTVTVPRCVRLVDGKETIKTRTAAMMFAAPALCMSTDAHRDGVILSHMSLFRDRPLGSRVLGAHASQLQREGGVLGHDFIILDKGGGLGRHGTPTSGLLQSPLAHLVDFTWLAESRPALHEGLYERLAAVARESQDKEVAVLHAGLLHSSLLKRRSSQLLVEPDKKKTAPVPQNAHKLLAQRELSLLSYRKKRRLWVQFIRSKRQTKRGMPKLFDFPKLLAACKTRPGAVAASTPRALTEQSPMKSV